MEEKPGEKEKMAMRGVCANDEKNTAARVWNLYRTKIVGQSTETKTYASAARWHRRLNEGQTKLLCEAKQGDQTRLPKIGNLHRMRMGGQWFQRHRF